jgi:hypothetical protein
LTTIYPSEYNERRADIDIDEEVDKIINSFQKNNKK